MIFDFVDGFFLRCATTVEMVVRFAPVSTIRRRTIRLARCSAIVSTGSSPG